MVTVLHAKRRRKGLCGSTATPAVAMLLLLLGCVGYYSWFHYNDPSIGNFALGNHWASISSTMQLNAYVPNAGTILGTTKASPYQSASSEAFVIREATTLGLDAVVVVNETAASCRIIKDPQSSPHYGEIQQYIKELAHYGQLVKNFTAVPDVRRLLAKDRTVCNQLELHPAGLAALFPSGQLSFSSSGYVEPLLPPLRHPGFCEDMNAYILRLDFLVHDFAFMCRKLKPTSRTVLVDMGASLLFHEDWIDSPAEYLIKLFRKFGFPFDHIYAYEITPINATDAFKRIPRDLHASYHWINVGVDADPSGLLNPLRMIAESYDADDFIVVKLDIDTPSIEGPLARQLLHDTRFSSLIDHFYFEHHVITKEMLPWWGPYLNESVKDSLELFQGLRKKGIPAHYWV